MANAQFLHLELKITLKSLKYLSKNITCKKLHKNVFLLGVE